MQKALDRWWPTLTRYGGYSLAAYEVLVDNFEHPEALVLAAGMMGLKGMLEGK